MVDIKVLVHCGIASFDFRLPSFQEQSYFTANMLKKLIKRKQSLPWQMEFDLKDEYGLEVYDGEVLAASYPDGTTLQMTIRQKRITNMTRACPYDGIVLVEACPTDDIVLFSPLQPYNFVKSSMIKEESETIEPGIEFTSVPDGHGMQGYGVSFGLNYLKHRVNAYFVHGEHVWFWMADGQVRQSLLVTNLLDHDGLKKKLRRSRKKQNEKMQRVKDECEGLKELYEKALDLLHNKKKETRTLQRSVTGLKNREEYLSAEVRRLVKSLSDKSDYVNYLEESSNGVEQLRLENNSLHASLKYLEEEKTLNAEMTRELKAQLKKVEAKMEEMKKTEDKTDSVKESHA